MFHMSEGTWNMCLKKSEQQNIKLAQKQFHFKETLPPSAHYPSLHFSFIHIQAPESW